MVTAEAIQALQRRASVSSLEALQALSVSEGNLERAIDFLRSPASARKSLLVSGTEPATGMATRLVAAGLWFECERIDRQQWRFTVSTAGFDRAIALHQAALREAAAAAPAVGWLSHTAQETR